ncbi:unnamed protein product, partial [Pylaiella littoralis]
PAANKNPAPATRQTTSSKPAPRYFEQPKRRPTGLPGGSGRPTRRPESWTKETLPNRGKKRDRQGWMARKEAKRKENKRAARVAREAHRKKVYLEAKGVRIRNLIGKGRVILDAVASGSYSAICRHSRNRRIAWRRFSRQPDIGVSSSQS